MTTPRSLPLLVSLALLSVSGEAAAASTLKVTKADCRRLVEHQPFENVTYREGVDVRGRAVAPADLPSTRRLRLPDDYVFDIKVRPFDFVERRHLVEETEILADALSENASTLTLGTVLVTGDGRAYFNGVALHDETQRALARGCNRALAAEQAEPTGFN